MAKNCHLKHFAMGMDVGQKKLPSLPSHPCSEYTGRVNDSPQQCSSGAARKPSWAAVRAILYWLGSVDQMAPELLVIQACHIF